jgi:hypothetical protein
MPVGTLQNDDEWNTDISAESNLDQPAAIRNTDIPIKITGNSEQRNSLSPGDVFT